MGADLGLLHALLYVYIKSVCAYTYIRPLRDSWRKCGLYAYARCDRWEIKRSRSCISALVSCMHACLCCIALALLVRRGACVRVDEMWPGALKYDDRSASAAAAAWVWSRIT